MAIVLVQSARGAANAASVVATYGSATTVGNTLVAFGYTNGAMTGQAITGWTKTLSLNYSGTGQSLCFFTRIADGTETNITLSGTSICRLHIAEFSGLTATITTDTSNTNTTTTTTTISTNSITTTNNDDLVLVAAGTSTGETGTRSWNNSFTILQDDATSFRLLSGYQIVSTTGSYSSTATIGASATNCGALIIALQAPPPAPTVATPGFAMPNVVPFLS